PPRPEQLHHTLVGIYEYRERDRKVFHVFGDGVSRVAGVRIDANDLNFLVAILFLQIEKDRYVGISDRALRSEKCQDETWAVLEVAEANLLTCGIRQHEMRHAAANDAVRFLTRWYKRGRTVDDENDENEDWTAHSGFSKRDFVRDGRQYL